MSISPPFGIQTSYQTNFIPPRLIIEKKPYKILKTGIQTSYQDNETQKVEYPTLSDLICAAISRNALPKSKGYDFRIPSQLIRETKPYEKFISPKTRRMSIDNGKYTIYTKSNSEKWVENISWSAKGIIKAYLNWNVFLNNYSKLSLLNFEEILRTMIPNHLFEGLENILENFCDRRLIDTRFLPISRPFIDADLGEAPFQSNYSRHHPLTEIIDVDVSIWHSIILTLSSDLSERRSDGPIHHLSFNDIKKNYFWIAQNREKSTFEISVKKNYSLYQQNDNGEFRFICELRDKNELDSESEKAEKKLKFTKAFYAYKFKSEEEIDEIGQIKIDDKIISALKISDKKKKILSKWIGCAVTDALDHHLESEKSKEFTKANANYLLDFIPDFYKKTQSLKNLTNWDQGFDFSKELYALRQCKTEIPLWYSKLIKQWENSPIKSLAIKIFEYLEKGGNENFQGITCINATTCLKLIKIIDLSFPYQKNQVFWTKSFQIRQTILKIGASDLTTNEVFTLSLNPNKFNEFSYLYDEKNWIHDVVGLRAQKILEYNFRLRSLAERIKEPVIFAPRGNTGLGKSHYIKNFCHQYLIDPEQPIDGVLSPDIIKVDLKKNNSRILLNAQVYKEATIIFEGLVENLCKNAASVKAAIIDTRLLTTNELAQLLKISKGNNARLEIVDLEGSIWNSVISVLHRDTAEEAPRVAFAVIKDGFIRARQNRNEFISICQKENVNYSLFYKDEEGNSTLVCQTLSHNLYCKNEVLFQKCLSQPALDEYEIGNIKITKDLIASHTYCGKQIPSKWIGCTIEQALEIHSKTVENEPSRNT